MPNVTCYMSPPNPGWLSSWGPGSEGYRGWLLCCKASWPSGFVLWFFNSALGASEVNPALMVNISRPPDVPPGSIGLDRGLLLLLHQGPVYFLEGGAFLCVPPPAAQHDLVEGVRTQPGLG